MILVLQVLFKNLDVDLKAEPPTSLLKDRIRKAEGNPDFSSKDARQQIVGAVNPGMPSTQNGVQLPHDIGSPSHPSGHSSLISQVCVIFYFLNVMLPTLHLFSNLMSLSWI